MLESPTFRRGEYVKGGILMSTEAETREEIEALKIENAVLKDKIATMSRQLEKFSRAIENLTQLDV